MSTANFQSSRAQVLVFLALQGAALLGIAAGDPRQFTWQFIALYLLLYACLMGAYTSAARQPESASYALILGGAVLLRALALLMPGTLSDDAFRYLWEGRIGLAGFNPYLLAPNSVELLSLRDAIQAAVNHPELPSVYPPVAQLLFQAMAALAYHPLTPRVTFAAFDLLCVVTLRALLKRRAQAPCRLLLYAWNPLPILEFAGAGHLDSAALLFLLLALLVYRPEHRLPLASALLLSLGALVKVFPVTLLPPLLVQTARRKGSAAALWLLGGAAAWMLILGFPLLDAGRDGLQGLLAYGQHWSFNASVFGLLEPLLGNQPARIASVLIFAGVLAGCCRPGVSLERGAYLLSAASFLLSPTAHPWYLCYTLAFMPLFPSAGFLTLGATVGISYAVFSGNSGWQEPWWLPWVVYLPPGAMFLARDLLHSRPVDNL